MEREKSRKIVILTLTEYCNLDCVYCYEHSKTNSSMSLDVAKKIVKTELLNSDDYDEVEFDLFGGEPTIRKKMIVDLVEWTYSQSFKKSHLFFLDTNGTLLDDVFQNWLIKYNGYIYAGISVDGTPETHNRNRSNSYEKIPFDFFVSQYPEQPARMTVYPDTIDSLATDIAHIHELGFKEVTTTFAFGISWNLSEIKEILIRELKKLCDFYLDNTSFKECSILDMNLQLITSDTAQHKWCGTGTSMASYDINGKKYPCQTFQPNTTGTVKPIEFHEIDFSKISSFSDTTCSSCIVEPICPNCYGINYVTRGDILKKDMGLCGIVKLRAQATAYLLGKKIERGSHNMKSHELYSTIKGIQIIQNSFT